MENATFSYQYSAKINKEVENIRKKYMLHEESKLDTLKKLDRRVQSARMIESLCLGVIGALVFGIGLCFGLDVLAGAEWLTVLLVASGIAIMIPAYPIYRAIEKKTRAKLAPEILRISEEIMRG